MRPIKLRSNKSWKEIADKSVLRFRPGLGRAIKALGGDRWKLSAALGALGGDVRP